ncbi:DUF4282 domain-containing protein [Bradyrhizobium sp. 197]|uniref:DUF4282 domain-containing protein n=1 Tax=Bradyrhizobium sp. 197 TaxID=2782663 RepID=UPI001FF9C6FE|nr:DUF4282 domain-containing protein [Bradyrhizobium sp. 197]MCK1480494.1 DUF4282 domain-containing protein [Bradyrhizobium sp. 197]
MFEYRGLFRWDQFITPLIIKPFFVLVVAVVVLSGLFGILSGLTMMAISPFSGFIAVLLSLLGAVVAMMLARIACEFVLITFRINEHLGHMREQQDRH